MGFFSWKTQDTDTSIANRYCKRKRTFTVHMHDDKGNKWTEPSYEGYGVFGGKDFFVLLTEMNGKSSGDFETDRETGIDLYHSGKRIKCPNLSSSIDWQWTSRRPKDCPRQGYF